MKKVAMNQMTKRENGLVSKKLIMTSILVLFFLLCIQAVSFAKTVEWQFRPQFGESDSSPAVGDLDDDGVLDLIFCSTSGRIFALDANGHQKWFFDAVQTISTAPTLADLQTNQPKVYALTNPGKIICLDGKSGARLWDYSMPGGVDWGSTLIVAADINKTEGTEIVVADKTGNLVCLSNQGSPLWMIKHKNGFTSAPAIADLDSDGQMEILIGTIVSPLVCFSDKGKEKWQLNESGAVGSSPVVCDLNQDKRPDILVGQNEGLTMLDSQGKVQWRYPMRKKIHDAVAVGDIDDDGKEEIIVVDLFGQTVCLDHKGQLLWKADVEERVRRSPAIADLDGDSVPEIIIGGYSAALHIFDTDGNLKERIPLSRAMNSSPTVVNFHGDNKLSLVVAAETDVSAYTWMDARPEIKPPVLWGEYRANSARTGSIIQLKKTLQTRISFIDYGGLYVGSNEFKIRIANPKKQSLSLDLEITKNNEPPFTAAYTASDSFITHQITYTIIGQSPVNLTFRAKLRAGKQILAKREEAFYLIPFAKDLADLQKVLSAISTQIPALPDQTYARDQLTIMNNHLLNIEEEAKLAGILSPLERNMLRDEAANLRNNARRLIAMTESAVEAGAVLAVYEANPWAPFAGSDEILEGRIKKPDLKIEAFGGETEYAALNLANYSSHAITVRIVADPLLFLEDSSRIAANKIITFHEVLDVPTQSLDLSADALPLLGQAQTIILPAWDVRQVWLNVNVSGLNPGEWQTVLRFRTLDVESMEAVAGLSVKVWKAKLADEQQLKLCHWGYVHSSILKDQPDAAFQDQVSHGTNVFVATNTFAPWATFDKNGDIIDTIDFSDHDLYIRQHAENGLILFFNYQASLKGPADRFTEPWTKAYKQWLKAWVDHLLQMGIGYEKFAFYPIDEPGLNEGLVDDFIAYSKPIREIDPKIQIYTDPVARASLSDLKRMAPYVDIWCPNRIGYLLDEGLDKLAYLKSTGKTVWTYECEGNAKHQSPLGYYRGQAWLAWHRGLSGIGFWSYCTSSYDPWYVPQGGADYLLIYQGAGVVTSKRWEAIRDGIEDYTMLMQLQSALEKAAKNKDMINTVRSARELLSIEAATIAGFCGIDPAGTQPGASGLSVVRQLEDERWQKYKKIRRKIAQFLTELN